jgi:2-phosphoglycerate kinase
MALAHAEGFKKCVSTDTIREIVRCYSHTESVHRPSYGGTGDAVLSWRASCRSLHFPAESVLDHTLDREESMILEGVALDPSVDYTRKWDLLGAFTIKILVKISDEHKHHDALQRRGYHKQLKNVNRIRAIQAEMVAAADKNGWLQLEQRDPSAMLEAIQTYFREKKNTLNIVQ